MSKISNVITMLQLLQTGRKYSINELATKLEISERMVRQYKEDLDKAGIYIDTIMGPYGGYVLNRTIRVPIRKFNSKDVKLLDEIIKKENDVKKKSELVLLQDKIKGIYIGSKDEERELKEDILDRYNVLMRAIKEKRKVKIKYYSYKYGETERVICPAEMFLFQDGWYCAAFCELRQDMRHFELKRISEFKLLEEKFI